MTPGAILAEKGLSGLAEREEKGETDRSFAFLLFLIFRESEDSTELEVDHDEPDDRRLRLFFFFLSVLRSLPTFSSSSISLGLFLSFLSKWSSLKGTSLGFPLKK